MRRKLIISIIIVLIGFGIFNYKYDKEKEIFLESMSHQLESTLRESFLNSVGVVSREIKYR